MKSIESGLQTVIESGKNQTIIAKVELFKTSFPAPSWGINTVFYKNALDASGTPYAGDPIDASYDALTGEDVYLQPDGQLWEFYGLNRPLALPSTENHFITFEGYFIVPSDVSSGVEFNLIANQKAEFYASSSSSSYPSALLSGDKVISTTASANADALSGGTWSNSWAADSAHTIRLDWTLYKGAYSKCILLWRPVGETDWRLVDSSVVNTEASLMTVDDTMNPASDALRLPGVMRLQGTHERGRASYATFEVALGEASGAYTYDADTDSFGVLRPNRMVKVYTGYNTNSVGTTPASTDWIQDGTYFIDSVALNRTDGQDVLRVSCRDTRKKAADSLNLLYPNILSYDLAGYNSDGVLLDPDGTLRWVAYDSWTLAKAFRDVLFHAGFSSEQLFAQDSNGNYLIEENSIRLDRGKQYRLKLPQATKQEDLKFAYDPGMALLDIANDLAEKFGYEWGVNYQGNVYFKRANNPNQYAVDDATITYASGTWTESDHIKSYKGLEKTISSGTGQISITPSESFRAFNLIFNRLTDTGEISVSVDGSPVTGWQNYDLTSDVEWYWRDGNRPADGVNPSVLEVGRNLADSTHTITIDTTGALSFGGLEVYVEDRTLPDITFANSRVTRLEVENTDQNIRNDVTVAGDEKGVGIDELIYARSIDIKSVTNPASKNYIGTKRPIIYPDPSINRQDVVDYQSLAILKRYRTLADQVNFEIPSAPHLEIGDTIQITDGTSGLTGNNFWVNQLSWQADPDRLVMTTRLDPYPPYPSYDELDEPSDPTGVVTDFTISRTDGNTLDPAFFTDNTLSQYVGPDSHFGCYIGRFSEEDEPVFIQIDFSLWKTSVVTLLIKDATSMSTVAVIADQELMTWGKHTYLWDGKWFDADHSTYRYFPVDPDWDIEEDLKKYFNRRDPFKTSGNLGDVSPPQASFWTGAGYFIVEMIVTPVFSPETKSVKRAVNADDTSLDRVKVILPKTYPFNVPQIQLDHPTYSNTELATDIGARYEVYPDEFTPSGVTGIKYDMSFSGQEVKVSFYGTLDCFVLLSDTADLSANTVDLLVYRQDWDMESIAAGPHLYLITDEVGTPWTKQLVAGETDFLSPGDFSFVFDIEGMPLKNRKFQKIELRRVGTEYRQYSVEDPADFHKRVVPFTSNYLELFNNLYPDRYVSAAFYLYVTMKAVPRNGIDSVVYSPFEYKLESSNYASNKHTVYPYAAPFTYEDWGGWAYTTERRPDLNRKVHFTCYGTPNYSYD